MLRERRSIEELDELLTERIENLRSRRRAAARLLKEQQAQEEGEAKRASRKPTKTTG